MKLFLITFFLMVSIGIVNADTRFKFGENVPILNGNSEYVVLDFNLINSNHNGIGNKIYAIRMKDMILNANALGTAIEIGQGWHYGLKLATNLGILFGPTNDGTQIYFDGSILSISNDLIIYGDLSLNDKTIKNFDKMAIKNEDVNVGICDQDQIRIDVGGATKELCYCDINSWLCSPLRKGPVD